MAGRLLAAGGIYHQNPERYAETAHKLGGAAAEGFDEVLNEQTLGSLVALSSMLAAGRGALHIESVTELQKLKTFLGRYKGKTLLLENTDVVKMDYIKRSNIEYSAMRREFDNQSRKIFIKKIADHPDVIARLSAEQRDMLRAGRVPTGFNVHHKFPLEDSGNNDFDNLILIKDKPYHPAFTTAQQHISRSLNPKQQNIVLWPVPRGVIYP